ncbi:hypothetical protein LFYK43_14010 [Ligilactobacillus salitolerans]|uniref:Uncharacterized protein n=1 Tax=Ligilactobacillus salitolerans TaxID=1808352 RepID=A0A401ITT1_9LACO|nr:hypothetical protein [Ligilactobacillus salitolerans]GBG94942.1 hypothetical protein LFYK43_14010 [Ligilactobacillus salitolerans]
MDAFEGIMVIIAIIAAVIMIGFAITWLVGISGKLTTVKRVGKLGTLIVGTIMIVSGGMSFGIDTYIQHQYAQQDKEFEKYAKEFRAEYSSIWGTSEDVGNDIQDRWETAIDNTSYDEDFDPTDTITMAVNANEDGISDMSDEVKKLEGTYALLKANDTGTYDFNAYKKAYKEIKEYSEYVSDPSGESYYSFNKDFGKYDQEAKKLYKNLTE